MSPTLYNSLRSYIFGKIVPTITNVPYIYQGQNYTISCTFATARSSVAVSTTSADTLIITAPISGQVTTAGGNMSSFSGTATLNVFLDNLYIAPCATLASTSDDDGATWSNCLNVTAAAFSAPTVVLTQGQSNQGLLQSFFQSGIDAYVASSPNSLGTQTAENLPQYFAPTYQRFITLTSDPTDLRVVLMCMVDNTPAPSEDPHSAFESTPLLSMPAGSNAVAAFNDYTLYEYVAQQIEGHDSQIAKASVSQNPAVLSATFNIDKGPVSVEGALQSQIVATYGSNGAFQNVLSGSFAFDFKFTYYTTVALLENSDGGQTFLIENVEASQNVTVNQDSWVVISVWTLYGFLAAFSPLGGTIFWQIIQVIKNAIINGLLKVGSKLEFDLTKTATGKVEFTGVTLNGGVVLSMNISLLSAPQSVRVDTVPLLRQPVDLNDGISQLASVLDLVKAPSSPPAPPAP